MPFSAEVLVDSVEYTPRTMTDDDYVFDEAVADDPGFPEEGRTRLFRETLIHLSMVDLLILLHFLHRLPSIRHRAPVYPNQ